MGAKKEDKRTKKTAEKKDPKQLKLEQLIKDETARQIRSYDAILALFIIKAMTDEDHAMSIHDVSEQLNYLFKAEDSDLFPERTIRRKMDNLAPTDELRASVNEHIKRLITPLIGGTVESRAADGIERGTNKKNTGSQRRFYFEPVLGTSDLDLISGALMSSRYLSEDEKMYLLSRLSMLQPGYSYAPASVKLAEYTTMDEIPAIPKRPTKNKAASLPMDSSELLKHVQFIYDAVLNGYKLEMTYGMYDKKEGSSSMTFLPRNEDKPYIINPYALFWNKGEYYLLATHKWFKNPVHFRLDRIIKVSPYMVEDKSGNLKEEKRDPIPDVLTPFFKRTAGKLIFDGIKYAGKYPDMKIYHKPDPVTCVFECTSMSLQVLVDYFGTNIHLAESTLPHSKDEVDINGKPQHFLTATINGIQRENAFLFCVEHAKYFKLLSPQTLVDDVRAELKRIAKEY